MAKNLHKDKLESFFQKTLEGYGNDPSEQLWERIADNIPPKPKRKLANLWWILLLMVCFAIIAFFLIRANTKINELDHRLENKETQINNLNGELNALKNKLDRPAIPKLDAAQQLMEDSLSKAAETKRLLEQASNTQIKAAGSTYKATNLANNLDPNKNKQTAAADDQLQNQASVNEIPDEKNNTNKSNDNLIPPTNTPSNLANEDATNDVAFSHYFVDTSLEALPTLIVFNTYRLIDKKKINIVRRQKRNISIGILSNYSEHGVIAAAPKDILTTENTLTYNKINSYSANILANIDISKRLAVVFGLGYRNIGSTGMNNVNFIYKEGHTNTGVPLAYRQEFESPLGDFSMTSFIGNDLQHNVEDIMVGMPFSTHIQLVQNLQFLRIPLMAKYNVGLGNLRAVAQSGIIFNSLLKGEISLTQTALSHDRLYFDATESVEYNNLNNFFFEANVALGLEYQLYRRFYLSLTGNYSRAFTPISNDQVLQQSFGLNAGLFFNL